MRRCIIKHIHMAAGAAVGMVCFAQAGALAPDPLNFQGMGFVMNIGTAGGPQEPETLGIPFPSTKIIQGTVTEENGDAVVCTTASGDPAKFNVFNLETGQVLHSFDIPAGKTFWVHGTDSAGNVYFAGYLHATLYRYSPLTKTVEDLGALFGEVAALSLAFDDSDNVYIGTYPGAKLIKYNAATGELSDLGNMLPGEQYLKSLAFHNGFLYGGGLKQEPQFVKINLATLERTILPRPATSDTIVSYYYATAAGGKLFFGCGLNTDELSLFIFDPSTDEWLDFEAKKFQYLVTSPEIDGKVYYPADGQVHSYDLTTGAVADIMPYGTAFRCNGTATLKSDERFGTPSYVNLFYGSGEIAIYNFATGQSKIYPRTVDPAEGVVSSLHFFNGEVIAGAYMGTTAAFFSPENCTVTKTIPMGQPESMGDYGSKAYFGVYPSARYEEFDPALPVVADQNPKVLFDMKDDGQSRPYGIAFSGTKLIGGFIADYGLLDGALAVYDLETGALQKFKNLIPHQSIGNLTAHNGTVYGGSTVWGGLGIDPTETAAKVFAFDPEAGTLLRSAEITVPGASVPAKALGGFVFGPDELLWAVAYGTVVAMDPVTFEVKKSIDVMPTNWSSQSITWQGYPIFLAADGMLIAAPGNTLVRIDPSTSEWHRLLLDEFDGQIADAALSGDGDVYFIDKRHTGRLMKLSNQKILKQ